jgi:hypothetical protein
MQTIKPLPTGGALAAVLRPLWAVLGLRSGRRSQMGLTMQLDASRRRALMVAAASAVNALLPLATGRAQTPALAAQRSAERGVTVSVRPLDLSPAAQRWMFEVVLDTHSADLSDELAKTAVLVDDRGSEHRPAAWKGDPPGGHHRKGTLDFAPVVPRPGAVELRVQRPGEPAPRVFRWGLQ